MHQLAIRSHLTFTFPLNEETYQELQRFLYSLKNNPSANVPTPDNIVDDPPLNEVVAKEDVPDSINFLDNPPTFVSAEVPKPNVEHDLSDEIMFEDNSTVVGVFRFPLPLIYYKNLLPQNHVLILVFLRPPRNFKKKKIMKEKALPS